VFNLLPGQGLGIGTSRRLVFGLGSSEITAIIGDIFLGFKKVVTTGFRRVVAVVQFKHEGV